MTLVTSHVVLRHPKRDASKKTCQLRLSRNSTKFDVLARFRETIPTIKNVSSYEIYRINFGFLIEIMILPFFQKLEFLGSYRGNSAHDSSTDKNHKLLPSWTASKHIPVRPSRHHNTLCTPVPCPGLSR